MSSVKLKLSVKSSCKKWQALRNLEKALSSKDNEKCGEDYFAALEQPLNKSKN